MGAFELNTSTTRKDARDEARAETPRKETYRAETEMPAPTDFGIIAMKVYDACSMQLCLDDLCCLHKYNPKFCTSDPGVKGPSEEGCTDELLEIPDTAVDVSVDFVRVESVKILKKKPSRFKNNGYWDFELEFVFVYGLTFFDECNCIVGDDATRWGCNTFRKSMTMYGSSCSKLSISSDLPMFGGDNGSIKSEPYIFVEAEAVALAEELADCFEDECDCGETSSRHHGGGRPEPAPEPEPGVKVVVGLYAIIKMFRIVNLCVESTPCELPPECCPEEAGPVNPCKFFHGLPFPRDIFNPPVKG